MKVHSSPGVRWSVVTLSTGLAEAAVAATSNDPATPSIFNPASTPAYDIYHLSLFVMAVCLGIFLVVFSLIMYAIKFRNRGSDDGSEPPQIYGGNRLELAWMVIPILIVVMLFLAARVIHAVENARFPPDAIRGQRRRAPVPVGISLSWLRFRRATELRVPVSQAAHPTPTKATTYLINPIPAGLLAPA